MTDKYNIYISYTPPYLNGQQEVNINGTTQSIPTYSSEYWVASMPEIKMSATGSSPDGALSNLFRIFPSNTGDTPLSFTRTW